MATNTFFNSTCNFFSAAFEKMKSDITNNISDIDQQKRNCLSDISDMRKSLNDHLDKMGRNSWQLR
jgi:hypothetical protein